MTDIAPATAPADAAAPVAAEAAATPAQSTPAVIADSTAATESPSGETSQSLLSSAPGPKPEQPAPAAEPKPDVKAADAPKEQPAKPDDPGKAPEVKADAATDPAKDATAPAPPAPVSLEDFKLPEGLKLDDERAKAFLETVNEAKLGGEKSQRLLDLHVEEMARFAKDVTDHQRKVWDDLNAGWKDQTRKDPELGGNRLNTSLGEAKAVIEEYGGSPENKAEIYRHIDNNGMGNFLPVIRMFHNISKALNIFEDSMVPSNPKAPPQKGPGNRGWYDKSLNAPGT